MRIHIKTVGIVYDRLRLIDCMQVIVICSVGERIDVMGLLICLMGERIANLKMEAGFKYPPPTLYTKNDFVQSNQDITLIC